jgi:predicted nucleotidyltransferase
MSIREEVLKYIRENKERFKKEYGVKKIYLFGSVARGEDREDSDIDLLVEFDEDRVVTIFTYMDFLSEFENKFKRKVDVATKDMIKPLLWKYMREDLVYA